MMLVGPYKPAEGDIAITVARAQQAVLYRQLITLAIIPFVTSTLIAFSLKSADTSFPVFLWYAVYVPLPISLLVLLLINKKAFKSRAGQKGSHKPFTGRLTRISENVSTLSGMFWGLATPLLAFENQELLIFMAVVQIAHACGFAQIVAPLPRLVFRFTALSLLPLTIMLLTTGNMLSGLLGLLSIAVFGSIMLSTSANYAQLRKIVLSETRAVRTEALLRASIDAIPDAFAVYDYSGAKILENKNHKSWALDYAVPASDVGDHVSRTADDKWFKHSWNLVPDVGTLTIHADITSQKLRESQLIQAREEAQLANGAQSRFLSRISHELRTPLNSVLGFSELLDQVATEKTKWETVQEYGEYIHSAGKHLLSLVDDIIDYTTIGDDVDAVDMRAIDVRSVLKRSVSISRTKAGVPSQHQILTRLHNDVMVIKTDRQILERILANIISNAIKFSRPDSKIAISTSLSKTGKPVLTVRDFGCGLSQDQINNAFNVFYQADDSHERASEGTGMGLAVVYKLAGLIGVDVQIISKPERGTAVIMTFNNEETRSIKDAAEPDQTIIKTA